SDFDYKRSQQCGDIGCLHSEFDSISCAWQHNDTIADKSTIAERIHPARRQPTLEGYMLRMNCHLKRKNSFLDFFLGSARGLGDSKSNLRRLSAD
ncbi:hypothetical protein ABTD94_21360, partial [Acinetobacter baumannii]